MSAHEERLYTTEEFIRGLIAASRRDPGEMAHLRGFLLAQVRRAEAAHDADAVTRWRRLYEYAAGPEGVDHAAQEAQDDDH